MVGDHMGILGAVVLFCSGYLLQLLGVTYFSFNSVQDTTYWSLIYYLPSTQTILMLLAGLWHQRGPFLHAFQSVHKPALNYL